MNLIDPNREEPNMTPDETTVLTEAPTTTTERNDMPNLTANNPALPVRGNRVRLVSGRTATLLTNASAGGSTGDPRLTAMMEVEDHESETVAQYRIPMTRVAEILTPAPIDPDDIEELAQELIERIEWKMDDETEIPDMRVSLSAIETITRYIANEPESVEGLCDRDTRQGPILGLHSVLDRLVEYLVLARLTNQSN